MTGAVLDYNGSMIRIFIPDEANKRRALGFLLGWFSFKSFATGEMLVPDFALPALARQGISFIVEGPATFEQIAAAFGNAPFRTFI
jgi:hypothetical protein